MQYMGGQAVLDGVMMRGPDVWAVAVRRPDGAIHTEAHDLDPLSARVRALRLPFVRGVVALGQSLSIGFRALAISARVAVIPGRNVIGIEMPNQTRQTVYMRELLESLEASKETLSASSPTRSTRRSNW